MWSLVWSPVPLDLMEKDLALSAFLQGPSSWSNLRGSRLMKINLVWASLVVQWLRVCLAMQGTWVPSLVQKDSHLPGSN